METLNFAANSAQVEGRVFAHAAGEGHQELPKELPKEVYKEIHKIVAIAASLGGLAAITAILQKLPVSFPAAVVIVQHAYPHSRSYMPEILRRRIDLPVELAQGGDRLHPGRVYIAQPNFHLQAKGDGTMVLMQTERVNYVRPSADVLFQSIASTYGDRAIAAVLTGRGVDGAAGIQAIKRQGGCVIVQDKITAEAFGMPGAAIATGMVDFVLPLSEISSKLVMLVNESA